jgi:hypothetical protein
MWTSNQLDYPILDGWNPRAPKIATWEIYKRRNENEVYGVNKITFAVFLPFRRRNSNFGLSLYASQLWLTIAHPYQPLHHH